MKLEGEGDIEGIRDSYRLGYTDISLSISSGSRFDDRTIHPLQSADISPESHHTRLVYDKTHLTHNSLNESPRYVKDVVVSPSDTVLPHNMITHSGDLYTSLPHSGSYQGPGLLLADSETCEDHEHKIHSDYCLSQSRDSDVLFSNTSQNISICHVVNAESALNVMELAAQCLQEELEHQHQSENNMKYVDDEEGLLTAADLKNKENILPSSYISSTDIYTGSTLSIHGDIKTVDKSPTKSPYNVSSRARPLTSPRSITPALRCRRNSVELVNVTPIVPLDKDPALSASLPSSPIRKFLPQLKRAKSKQEVNNRKRWSPLLRHRCMKTFKSVESSDDESLSTSPRTIQTGENYRNLESFQKAQLSKKVYFITVSYH